MAEAGATLGSDHVEEVSQGVQDEYLAEASLLDEPFNEFIQSPEEVDDQESPDSAAEEEAQQNKTQAKSPKSIGRKNSIAPEDDNELSQELPEEVELDPPSPEEEEPVATKPVARKTKARRTPTPEEEDPPIRKRSKSSKTVNKQNDSARQARARSRDRVTPRRSLSPSRTRERSARTASPQRQWREPINHNATQNKDDDGVRRSSRFKIAPLAFWRGEKVVYGRGSRRKSIGGTIGLTLPEAKEIIHVEPVPVEIERRRIYKSSRSSRKTKRHPHRGEIKEESESESDEEDGPDNWEEKITVEAPVRSFENQSELVKKILAIPETAYEPRPVVGQGIFFQKTLSEEPHFAAGVLDIPTGAAKPVKPSKQNTMFFFIFTGYVQVKIHDVVFRLRKGGQFTVPRGNFYEILNVGKKDARLFFSQSTDTLANHLIAHPELA